MDNPHTFASADEALRVEGLHKRVSAQFSLDAITIALAKGEGLALIGPNGAGKSTLVRVLAGLTRPDQGTVHVCGVSSRNLQKISRYVGFVQQRKDAPDDLTVAHYVKHQMRLKRADLSAYISLITMAKLQDFQQTAVAALSGGNLRKLHILCAIAHNPSLLILDEPTNGLDAEFKEIVLDYLQHLKTEGMSLVISTHHLEEIERLADHVAVLHQGRLVMTNSIGALVGGSSTRNCLELVAYQRHKDDERKIASLLQDRRADLPFVEAIETGAYGVRIRCKSGDTQHLPKIVAFLSQHHIQLGAIRCYEPTLVDVLKTITTHQL